jgi:hypothetical protein
LLKSKTLQHFAAALPSLLKLVRFIGGGVIRQ